MLHLLLSMPEARPRSGREARDEDDSVSLRGFVSTQSDSSFGEHIPAVDHALRLVSQSRASNSLGGHSLYTSPKLRLARLLNSDEFIQVSLVMMVLYITIVTLDTYHPLVTIIPEYYTTIYTIEVVLLVLFLVEVALQVLVHDDFAMHMQRPDLRLYFAIDLYGTVFALGILILIHHLQTMELGTTSESRMVTSLLPKLAALGRLTRIVRFLRIFAHSFRHARTSDFTQYLRGRIPAREVTQGITLVIGCAGIMLLITGAVTYLELQRTAFLRADLPLFAGGGIFAAGLATLAIAVVAWIAAYLSFGKEMTVGVLSFTCVAMLVRSRKKTQKALCVWSMKSDCSEIEALSKHACPILVVRRSSLHSSMQATSSRDGQRHFRKEVIASLTTTGLRHQCRASRFQMPRRPSAA